MAVRTVDDLREATERVVAQTFKQPTEWLVYLQIDGRAGVLRFSDKSWKKDSAAVLEHRFTEEFELDLTLTNHQWDRLRFFWEEEVAVAT